MTKSNLFEALTIVVAVVVVGAGAVGGTLLLTRNSGDGDTNDVQSSVAEREPQIQKVVLNVDDQAPITVQVRQGDYIQFEPTDDSKHQIISVGSGEHAEDGFDSGIFESTQSYRMQVKDIGTFELQDTFNPDQKITIQAT
ncbi:hypothetical protein KC959_03485 [Candidatus Saccharibacteria bacterium]|nr:hypothetical protein [Candidatus Saccharibacteria bacterium]MCA9328809.1 hypothetical protein [Candidatus Saccharibacteria bacterium]